MSSIGQQDPAVVRPRILPGARRTLVCLGFCGGGAGAYLPWADTLAPDTELAVVCYPGREGRFAEEFLQDWDELAEDAVRAVGSVAAERPYVLFGHSMGGWMAFDVASRIQDRGGPAPQALVVSSANAPSRGLTPQDMFPSQRDSDAGLLEWMRTFGLIPAHVLGDPDLRAMAVELMRADLVVRDTFRHRGAASVGMPLQVLRGADDPVIDPDTVGQWRALATGDYRHDVLPGGHFYTPEVWAGLPSRITALGVV
ncbi:thioesterase II family protein [Kitasatospora terrestris]|uniref:Alpha/beta fold hydrolase n=1 Tax=Kitasatospora terrestris TaxID=258051 RepID=A0ABP9DFG2_9ACTN